MIKDSYIWLVSFLFRYIPLSLGIRDTLMWPISTRVLGKGFNRPTMLKSGFTISAYLEDQLGRFALFYGPHLRYFWEPTTTRLMEYLVRQADTALLAGAHIGLVALYARKAMTKEGSRVYTFEPTEHLFEIAKKNFEMNHDIGTILIYKSALGDSTKQVTMVTDRIRSHITSDGAAPTENEETEDVAMITIDSFCETHRIQKIDFMLLDVEGYEYEALSGMTHLLHKDPPSDIVYEISLPKKDNLAAARRLDRFLKDLGYTLFLINDSSDPLYKNRETGPLLVEATDAHYADYQRKRYFNVLATRRTKGDIDELIRTLS